MTPPTATRLFGVRVAGVGLLLPQGEPLEYLAAAPVHPLPLCGPRVAGLVQLRGHPVVVLDAAVATARAGSPIPRRAVLVIGAAPDAAGLCVDGPPEPVHPEPVAGHVAAPDCAFRQALGEPLAQAPDARGGARLWWRFDARRLFELLAGDEP